MAEESARRDVGSAPTETAASPADADEQATDWRGREVAGRYRVLERIGEGGMGVVYLAEHLNLKKKVAFKVIHPQLASNEDLLLRFKREALATGQLDHPHIAAAIDFDTLDDGSAYMVMPWVRGRSLAEVVGQGTRTDWRRVCRLGAQIADALSAAHSVGIVHRDLKPDNILLEQRTDGSESAKVLDFGVASLTGRAERISVDAGKPLTRAGTILGTPGYMSPEQATAGEVDHRTDLYALGVILWELASGRRLFDGSDPTEIFAKQFKGPPPAPALKGSGPAAEVAQLVGQLLSWDKTARPDSAGEVRDRLRNLAERPDSPLSGFSLPRLPPLRLPPLPPRLQTLLRGERRRLLAAAGAVLVVSSAPLWWPSAQDPPKAPAAEAPRALVPPEGPPPADAPEAPSARSLGSAVLDSARQLIGGLPRELEQAQRELMQSDDRRARRAAAKRVRRYDQSKVPDYLKLVADLELARGCRKRRKVVVAIGELGDDRALPALERLESAPRAGCGFLRLQDCHRCLRRELREALEALD